MISISLISLKFWILLIKPSKTCCDIFMLFFVLFGAWQPLCIHCMENMQCFLCYMEESKSYGIWEWANKNNKSFKIYVMCVQKICIHHFIHAITLNILLFLIRQASKCVYTSESKQTEKEKHACQLLQFPGCTSWSWSTVCRAGIRTFFIFFLYIILIIPFVLFISLVVLL